MFGEKLPDEHCEQFEIRKGRQLEAEDCVDDIQFDFYNKNRF